MILLPSRRRIEHLKNFFKSAKETNTTSPGIVIVDTKDYIDNADEYLCLETDHMPEGFRLFISKGESMGDKLRELWDFYKNREWVCLLNDDHYFVTPEWDKKLTAHLDGKNFVSCNDNWVAKESNSLPAGATVWSGDLIRKVGFIFPPKLQHCFIDNIWSALGHTTGCWIKDLSVTVEHRHVDKGEAKSDETHGKMKSFFHTDGPIYLNWMENSFKTTVLEILELQNGTPRVPFVR